MKCKLYRKNVPFLMGVSQSRPVDKLKRNGFLYGILIISIAGSLFYDGKTKWPNPDGNSRHRFYDYK